MFTRILLDTGESSPVCTRDDRIFLGEGLFETLRVDSAKPCHADLHWQRLSNSAKALGIPFDLSYEEWLSHLLDQIKRDNVFHGGIKVILSGGSAPRGLVQQGQISQCMLHSFNYQRHTEPLRLVSSKWLRDSANPIYQFKSVNYLEAIIACRQAQADGADDVLFFNTQHQATETSCANFFIIQQGELITPPVHDGTLAGITQARLLTQCARHNIACKRQSISKTMIANAQAVFITNSLQGIRMVSSLDEWVFSTEHDLIKQLQDLTEPRP